MSHLIRIYAVLNSAIFISGTNIVKAKAMHKCAILLYTSIVVFQLILCGSFTFQFHDGN